MCWWLSRSGLLVASALLSPQALGAWVSVCDKAPSAGGHVRNEYLTPGGPDTTLLVDSAPVADCASRELPIPLEAVLWARLISPDLAGRLGANTILQGVERDGKFLVSEIITPQPESRAPSPLALETPLFKRFRIQPFGRESRADGTISDDKLEVVCKSGEAAAGIVLRNDGVRLPVGANLALVVDYTADAMFSLGVSDPPRLAAQSPLAIGNLGPPAKTVRLSLPTDRLQSGEPLAWTISCPTSKARLTIDRASLIAAAPPFNRPGRSAWAWRPSAWRDAPDALLERARAVGTTTLYISVPIAGGAGPLTVSNPESLARFIGMAVIQGISVWAVEGDPRAVLPAERGKFVARAEALAAYNVARGPDSRLGGIQYDIEPYLLPGYALDIAGWSEAYLTTLTALKAASAMPLEAAVPFWWSDVPSRHGPLLERLTPIVDGLAVMNYRTDPQQLSAIAESFLSWGVRSQRYVRIALEAGALGDEQRRHYRSAGAGELLHVDVAGRDVLVLLSDVHAFEPGRAWAYSHSSTFSGAELTFHDDPSRLLNLLPTLESSWMAWPSFGGVALHGLIE